MRLALEYVLPRSIIGKSLLHGYAENAGSVIAPANKFWHNPAVKPIVEDVKKAREVLAKAGYSWDNSGRLLYPG